MTRLHLIGPLGLLFAASAPWTCTNYVLPDGGTTSTNTQVGNSPTGGMGGNTYSYDASVAATVASGGSQSTGVADGPDGGITVGPASDFSSDFLYMSNASEGTVSRIVIPGDGGAPYEQARYFSVMPLDNHGKDEHKAWQSALACNAGTFDGGCVDAGAKIPVCATATVDAGCKDAGYTSTCATAKVDAGCVDAGQKLNCTTVTSDAGCVDAGTKAPICATATVDAGCVDAGPNPKFCWDAGSGELCIDGGQKAPICSSATVDAGCVDAGPKALTCSTVTSDGGCTDGGPKGLTCTQATVDAGCTDGGFKTTCTSATVDAGCVDAGFNAPICSTFFGNVCTNVDQLYFPDGGLNSPSRTVVDRNGNVFVVLRAPPYPGADSGTSPNLQAGVTKIINVGDHLDECAIRCPNRKNWQLPDGGGFPFTMGAALPLSDGGSLTLLPSTYKPIAAGTTTTQAFTCPGSTYTDETDPTNYDDCVAFSIPLGDPSPDPYADPSGLTADASFGRAGVVSPNCDSVTHRCDVWVGMWNGAKWIQLGYGATGTPYDVAAVASGGVSPYGATVDCRGILWSVGQTATNAYGISAITTVAVNDVDVGATPYTAPALTVLTGSTGLVNSSDCTKYGIASDPAERIWFAAGTGGAKACSFDGTVLLKDLSSNPSPATAAVLAADVKNAWRTYDFTSIYNTAGATAGTVKFGQGLVGTVSRGINLDRYGNVFMGMDTHPWSGTNPFDGGYMNGMAAVAFSTAGTDAGTLVPCGVPNSTGAKCPAPASLMWAYNEGDTPISSTLGGGTIGVDLDNEDRPWFGNFGGVKGTQQGLAVQLDAKTGALGYTIPAGNGVYSYSDFTGYALRHITLGSSTYETAITACSQEPELTKWNGLGWTADVPAGTNLRLEVAVVDALDNATLNAASYCTVCDYSWDAGCSNPMDLTGCLPGAYNLPQGSYLVINASLTPKACDISGTAPTLFTLSPSSQCAGN